MLEEASHNELNRRSSEIKQTKPKASNFFLPIYQKKANFSSQILQKGKKKQTWEIKHKPWSLQSWELWDRDREREREVTLDDDFTLINDNREKCQRGNASGNREVKKVWDFSKLCVAFSEQKRFLGLSFSFFMNEFLCSVVIFLQPSLSIKAYSTH